MIIGSPAPFVVGEGTLGDERTPPVELLAPAGDWEALRAAVANGADAVYFGLPDFNARLRAANFAVEELPEVIGYLHGHNVYAYITFNTLVFPDELPAAAARLAAIAEAGADAVIVQDLGVARLLRRLAPSLPIHASTQMTLTEPRGLELARRLGIQRAILARELSVAEIRRIAECAPGVELEVFVHGALCISVSGQCLASLALGGRSANRGLCAQACRLPYRLIADGAARDLGDRAYPLSPKDLAAFDRIEALVALGVRGFKIEGRLKSAQYVAAATRVYRGALDAAAAHRPFLLSPEQEEELAQGFSRGFSRGFLDGIDHQALVSGRSPKSRGMRVATVVGRTARGVVVEAADASRDAGPRLKPGDGVVFDDGGPAENEEGGRIIAVHPSHGPGWRPAGRSSARGGTASDRLAVGGGRVELVFHRGEVCPAAVTPGSIVWKTDDPAVRRRLEQTYARAAVARPVAVHARVWAALGQPLRIALRDDAGHEAEAAWDRPLERAEKYPLSLDLVRQQLGRLGNTPFELRTVEAERLDPVMVPKSVLNDLRRQAVDALLQRRAETARHPVAEPGALDALRAETRPDGQEPGPAQLCVLVRTPEQLDAALAWTPPDGACRPAMVYCDFEDSSRYRDAVARGRTAARGEPLGSPPVAGRLRPTARQSAAGLRIGLATLRIIKPGEEDSLEQILDAQPDAVLVRNLAGLSFFRERAPGLPLVGDFSLNAANDLAADLLAGLGLERLVPSHDLAWEQLAALFRRVPPGLFEIVIHHHMPMFHTQHCLFAANLSGGRDGGGCGRPCRQRVELRIADGLPAIRRNPTRDRVGVEHPVLRDAACRNTVFHGKPRAAEGSVEALRGLGIRHFRVELLRETASQAKGLLDAAARRLWP